MTSSLLSSGGLNFSDSEKVSIAPQMLEGKAMQEHALAHLISNETPPHHRHENVRIEPILPGACRFVDAPFDLTKGLRLSQSQCPCHDPPIGFVLASVSSNGIQPIF